MPRQKLMYIYDMQVIGSPRYIAQIRRALSLLKKSAPRDFALVKKYIGRIEQNVRSGMAPWQNPPTFYMSDLIALHSVTWCASCTVHDAVHSKLYLDYLWKKQETPPRRVYSGRKIELLCIARQLRVSHRICAPDGEIAHLKRQDGLHFRQGEKQWW